MGMDRGGSWAIYCCGGHDDCVRGCGIFVGLKRRLQWIRNEGVTYLKSTVVKGVVLCKHHPKESQSLLISPFHPSCYEENQRGPNSLNKESWL